MVTNTCSAPMNLNSDASQNFGALWESLSQVCHLLSLPLATIIAYLGNYTGV
jgi:hypothetical protein